MSRLISDLQRLLTSTQMIRQGTVTGVTLDVVSLASPDGPKNFKVVNPGTYRTGDKVRFQGDVFLGKVVDEAGVNHYAA